MDQQAKATLVAAVAAGYVLGRTRKGRLALTGVALVMGRSLEPRQLLVEGIRRLGGVPAVGALGDQLRREVYRAARNAAGAALTRRLGDLTGGGAEDDEEAEEAEDAEDAGEEAEKEQEPDGENGRAPSAGAPPKKKPPTKKPPAKKAPAKKPAAKKAPAKPAAKKAGGRTKGGEREKTSGGRVSPARTRSGR